MKKLLNFGVSDPLTLGMAHPVADRLETLGRARPTTWTSRSLALSAMGVIAFASAPLSIAANEAESPHEFLMVTNGHSYEIVNEDGEKKAYRILKGGDREEIGLIKKSNGTYHLTDEDGQIVELPDIDMDQIAGLKNLAVLEGLEGLAALDGLDGLRKLQSITSIKTLEGFEKLETLKRAGMMDGDVRVVTIAGEGGQAFDVEDTVVNSRLEFFQSSDPIETAQRQLERTKRQLESLSGNESVAFDLNNALRDIESAQKSLEEAESRLSEQDE